jgi:hypothetical protein
VNKNQRIGFANLLIKAISGHGRRFFHSEKYARVAYFHTSQSGCLLFRDEYTWLDINLSRKKSSWRAFTHGGTLKNLVELIAKYIHAGEKIHINWLGLYRAGLYKGDIWGYGD